jgi:chromosome segregation ATPase
MLRVPGVHGSGRKQELLRGSVVALAAVFLSALLLGDMAAAGKPKGHSKGKSGQSSAQKQKTIDQIKAQIASAKQVLATAEAKGQMSSAQVEEARKKLSDARAALDEAKDDERAAAETLNDIETDLIDSQEPDSKVGKAKAKLEEARAAYEKARAGGVSPNNPDYVTAKDALNAAKQEFDKAKAELFESDDDWVAAKETLREEQADRAEAKKQSDSARGSAGSLKEMRNASQVAAAARAIISQGEAKLRALGVKNSGSKPKKRK